MKSYAFSHQLLRFKQFRSIYPLKIYHFLFFSVSEVSKNINRHLAGHARASVLLGRAFQAALQVILTKKCNITADEDLDGDFSSIHPEVNNLLPFKSLDDVHYLLHILRDEGKKEEFVSLIFLPSTFR